MAVPIRWLTAFIDQPAEAFAAGTLFWQAVTESGLSSFRGDYQEFATLLPTTGDSHLRVQKTADGSSGVHLDLHVDSVHEARATAESLGAEMVEDRGHAIMRSAAGLTFCFVEHKGESVRTAPTGGARLRVLDQVCIDIPRSRFDHEVGFWAALTGWERRVGGRSEFEYLVRDPHLALRLLFQRLGEDDTASTARAHLDLACGEHRAEIAEQHLLLGATRVGEWEHWIAMRDPAGLPYCLTARDPRAGTLA